MLPQFDVPDQSLSQSNCLVTTQVMPEFDLALITAFPYVPNQLLMTTLSSRPRNYWIVYKLNATTGRRSNTSFKNCNGSDGNPNKNSYSLIINFYTYSELTCLYFELSAFTYDNEYIVDVLKKTEAVYQVPQIMSWAYQLQTLSRYFKCSCSNILITSLAYPA